MTDSTSPIRTGIFGGSFNPVHKGHIALAKKILEQGLVDEIWLMVSPQNPLKHEKDLMNDQLRLKLARLAIRNISNVKVSDFEFHLERPSYMVNTLNELQKAYPKRQFSLIIGADNWKVFPLWFHHEEILQNFPVIIYPRENYPVQADALPTGVQLLDADIFPVSSTEIRKRLEAGQDTSEWVTEPVRKELLRLQH